MRVVRLVEALAARPTQGVTLTELATTVGANKSTLLNVLVQLVDAGWLTRHGQTYLLGPGLMTVGKAAERSPTLTPAATPELEKLAARFQMPASASAPTPTELIVVDIVAPDGGATVVHRGQRVPFLAPTGAMFVAWNEEHRQHWASSASDQPGAQQDQLTVAIDAIRHRGYSIERLSEPGERLRQFSISQESGMMTEDQRRTFSMLLADLGTREYLDSELAESDRHPVSVIGAPVFGDAGEVLLGLSVHPYRELTMTEIHEMGAECVAAGQRIAETIRATRHKFD